MYEMDKLSACRICGNEVSVTHCVTLFSRESLAVNTPEWLSRVAAVPVIQDNGLSRVIHLCRWKDEPMLPPAWASVVIPRSEYKTEHTLLLHRTSYRYQATTTHSWKLKYTTDRCNNIFYWGIQLPRFWVMVSTHAHYYPCSRYQAFFFFRTFVHPSNHPFFCFCYR